MDDEAALTLEVARGKSHLTVRAFVKQEPPTPPMKRKHDEM